MMAPHELKNKAFQKEFRGYNVSEVDEYINFLLEKYTEVYRENNELQSKLKTVASKLEEISDEEIEKIIDDVLKSVHPLLRDECKVAIKENFSIDWYRKDSVISKIKVALTDALSKFNNMDRVKSKQQAIRLMDNILSKIKGLSKE